MMQAPASFDFAASSLEANIDALSLSVRTRELVRAAVPRGKIVRLPGGAPVVDMGRVKLGCPADLESRRRTLAEIAAQDAAVVVVFGLGVGHTVRELRARTRAKIIVYEPDPSVLRGVLEWGPCDLAGIPIASDLVDFSLLWSTVAHNKPKAVLVRTPGYEILYPEADRELDAMLKRLVSDIQINENTYHHRARVWLSDIFQNLPGAIGRVPFMALEGAFTRIPAFIVGAGPSLDKNGALLREATKKGIVISVNTSALALARHGVVPQVLACLESLDLSADLKRVPFIDEVVRAFSLSGSPAHLTTGKGPLLPTFENIGHFEPLTRLFGCRGLPVGASVTTSAFSLAERLGCDPIVMVGQDLAYTNDQIYARGTAYEGSSVRVHRDEKKVEQHWSAAARAAHGTSQGALPYAEPLIETAAWGGEGEVATSPSFAAVRAWLETAASVIARAHPTKKFVNATEGGARIAGFQELRLADVLAPMPDRAPSATDIARGAESTGRALSREGLHRWAADQKERCAKTERAATELCDLVAATLAEMDRGESARVAGAFGRLEEAEKALKQRSAEQPFVDAWSCSELQAIEAKAKRTRIPDSARDHALLALRTEAEIGGAITRAAATLTQRFSALESDTKPHTPT
jgi:hypothetical protein